MTRFRPRFTVRTLAILVTTVCAYFGAWEATKRHVESEQQLEFASWPNISFYPYKNSPMPFVIRELNSRLYRESLGATKIAFGTRHSAQYYLWLFGPEIKLPFHSEWED